MSTEALVTILALGVSVLALLPIEKRLEVGLRVGPLFASAFGASVVLIHYIKFYPVLAVSGFAPDFGPWRYGFNAESASYLIFISGVALCWAVLHFSSLRPKRIKAFQDLNDEFLFEARYPALLFLWQKHSRGLTKLLEGRHLPTRIRQRLIGRQSLSVEWLWEDGPDKASNRTLVMKPATKLMGRLLPLRRAVARLLPDYDDERLTASRMAERTFFSVPLVAHIAKSQPYFALDVLTIASGFPRETFLREYFSQLLRNPNSVFYEELRFSRNYLVDERYKVEKQNPFMYFFFGEQFWAKRLDVYRPLGNLVVNLLRERRNSAGTDVYSDPMGRYYEEGRWTCPYFGTIAFFDLMVTEAVHLGGRSHLWLVYLQYFVEEYLENLRRSATVKTYSSSEFPTRYHYLLYETLVTQIRWIKTAARLRGPMDSIVIDDNKLTSGSLTKSAIVSLGATLHRILSSDTLGAEFRGAMLGIALQGYADLPALTARQDLLSLYRRSVVRGGDRQDIEPVTYKGGLLIAYDNCDLVPFRFGGDQRLVDEIAAAIGR